MLNYETTFIIDPVLSGEGAKQAAENYLEHIKNEGAGIIVQVNEMGLRQLAYPIKNRTSGVYYCVEFSTADSTFINKLELAFRRDERIMRFLTVSLDKFGVKYNADRRSGAILSYKKKKELDARNKAAADIEAANETTAQ